MYPWHEGYSRIGVIGEGHGDEGVSGCSRFEDRYDLHGGVELRESVTADHEHDVLSLEWSSDPPDLSALHAAAFPPCSVIAACSACMSASHSSCASWNAGLASRSSARVSMASWTSCARSARVTYADRFPAALSRAGPSTSAGIVTVIFSEAIQASYQSKDVQRVLRRGLWGYLGSWFASLCLRRASIAMGLLSHGRSGSWWNGICHACIGAPGPRSRRTGTRRDGHRVPFRA